MSGDKLRWLLFLGLVQILSLSPTTVFGVEFPNYFQEGGFLQATHISMSEAGPVASVANGFTRGYAPGDQAFIVNRLQLGWRFKTFYWGLSHHYDYWAKFSAETAELVYLSENNLSIDSNRTYPIYLKVDHFKARGLFIGKAFSLSDDLTVSTQLTYLDADTLLAGETKGQVTADLANNLYQGQIELDYIYTQDPLLDRVTGGISANGITTDFSMIWDMQSHWRLSLILQDAFGYLNWKQIYSTRFLIQPVAASLDENGFINTTPTGTGIESSQDYQQTLEPKLMSYLSNTDKSAPYVTLHHNRYKTFATLGYQFIQPKYLKHGIKRFAIGYDWFNQSMDLKISGDHLTLQVQLSDTQPTQSETLNLWLLYQ